MRKIAALTVNEWIKISRKTSILVIAILMVVAVFGLGAIMRVSLRESPEGINREDTSWVRQAMMDTQVQQKAQLADMEAQLAGADPGTRATLESEIASLRLQIEVYDVAIEKDINLMSGDNYLADALRQRQALLTESATLQRVPEAQRTAAERSRIGEIAALAARYDTIVDNRDFAAYIALQNEIVRADTTLDKEERDLRTGINDLWLRLDPEGKDAEGLTYKGIRYSLTQVENLQRSLRDNLDYSGGSAGVVPMSPERRDEVANELAVFVFKLENGMPAGYQSARPGDTAVLAMTGVGLFTIILLMTILAGSAISNELSTGSIKSLIISPARRWKIYTAKLVSLLTTGALAGLLLYGVVMLAHGLYFGFGTGADYIFAVNGAAGETDFYLYQLLRLMVQGIDVAVYMMMAFMLSIITRNTAVSVGLSIAVYFSSSIVRAFLTIFEGREWVRFIPFTNMSLAGRIFPYDTSSQSVGLLFGSIGATGAPQVSFSLVYLAILLFCMGYIGLDSFTRRDIK